MKKSDIRVGGYYRAKVNEKLTTVRVDKIQETKGYNAHIGATVYYVTNMTSGRRTIFRSALKFRCAVPAPGNPAKDTSVVKALDIKRVLVEAVEEVGCDPFVPTAEKTSATGATATMPSSVMVNTSPVTENNKRPPVEGPMAGFIEKMNQAAKVLEDNAPHLIVEARAGTGKTTTLVAGLQVLMGLPPTDARGYHITPSPQQAAVWEQLCLSKGNFRTVAFCAFNSSIARELQSRVPKGCDAMTMHSMGYRAIREQFGNTMQVAGDKIPPRINVIMEEIMGMSYRDLLRVKPGELKLTKDLVEKCKMNLIEGYDPEELMGLISHFDMDTEGVRLADVLELVPRVLERSKDVEKDRCIDFDDMIWLPIVLDLPIKRYDLLLVDEVQDLNRCQHAMIKKASKRLVLCGDPKQAIYGFAGADSESMKRLEKELSGEQDTPWGQATSGRGVVRLPLTVTRRCGRAIVKEANKIVADFEAHETNPDGVISFAKYPVDREGRERPRPHYTEGCQAGDMVLCRVNAPLVSQCFRFLREGRKAHIQGKDVGQGLVNLIRKLAGYNRDNVPGITTIPELIGKLEEWQENEYRKEQAKKYPSESKLIAIQDKFDCLMCFTEDQGTVEGVIRKIDSIFTADKNAPGIRLSSIHKAKGLEADRVWLLEPEGSTVPHPMAKTPWEVEQEWNLRYVAITRAIKELVYVS